MKAIINGKRYDTDKAILVGTYDTGLGNSDFRQFEASLYRSPRSGAFFLAGRGHAMTVFCRQLEGGMRGWGEKIIPMDRDEALEWAESYLDAAAIEKAFSDTIEDA